MSTSIEAVLFLRIIDIQTEKQQSQYCILRHTSVNFNPVWRNSNDTSFLRALIQKYP